MISSMRDRFKSKKYQPIIWLALFSLVGAASLPELIKRIFGSGNWVMKIDGTEISSDKFAQKYEEQKQYVNFFKQQYGAYAKLLLSSGINLDPKELTINNLINEVLLNKISNKLNIQFDSDFLHQEIIKSIPQEVIKNYGTDLNLLAQLYGLSNATELENSIKENLKNRVVLELANASIYVPQFELKSLYNSTYAKKKYAILIFPFDKYLKEVNKIQLNKNEIKNFFDEENKKEKKYWIPEKREGIKWEFDLSNYSVSVTDTDIENYYKKNKTIEFLEHPTQVQVRRILFEAKDSNQIPGLMQTAQKIRNEIIADPTKFADFANKYSQDKITAQKGGLTDFFAKGQKDEKFERAAFALKNDGEVSEVIETKYGVEILQRVAKKPMSFKKLETVKDKIKTTVKKDKIKKTFEDDIKKLAKNLNLFKEFASNKNATQSKINLTPINNSVNIQKLFSIKNENDLVSQVDDSKGIVFQLTKTVKSHVPSLEEVQKTVENDLYKKKALEKMSLDLKKAKELSSGKSFEDLAKLFGATLKITPWINIESKEEIQKLNSDNIPVERLWDLEVENQTLEIINQNGFLIKLEHIEPFNIEKFESKKTELEAEIYRKRMQELESGFIASLKKSVNIKYNDKILNQFKSAR